MERGQAMSEPADAATKDLYRKMGTKELVDLARAFEGDMKSASGKPSVHFAAHRLRLIAEVLAEEDNP